MTCITEILKLKGDKEFLYNPEICDSIAVEGGGTYKNYEYLIVFNNNGHRCGYVAIPSGHKYDATPLTEYEFLGKKKSHYNYDSLPIDCHGGLTFMERNHNLKNFLKIPCNDFWIGFDCGHCYDARDIESLKKYFGDDYANRMLSFLHAMSMDGSVKDYDYVENVCKHIIDQLIEAK